MRVIEVEKLVAYARGQADLLQQDMRWVDGQFTAGWWVAQPIQTTATVWARATAAIEFLRRYAGPESSWTTRAVAATSPKKSEGNESVSGAREIGELLRGWADQVDGGIVTIVGSEALDEIRVVSTDVMTQVRQLFEDKQVHVAAPIVMCGAALEVALRATVEAHGLTLPEKAKPSISAYAGVLRGKELISKQDVKDIEALGGIRNSAAHGHFDDLDLARAGLMEQQTNMLLAKLAEVASP